LNKKDVYKRFLQIELASSDPFYKPNIAEKTEKKKLIKDYERRYNSAINAYSQNEQKSITSSTSQNRISQIIQKIVAESKNVVNKYIKPTKEPSFEVKKQVFSGSEISDDTLVTKANVENTSFHNNYLFGHFTRVFKPSDNNQAISDKLDEIMNSLREGKVVFVIGYGASGSGKTSAMISFKDAINPSERDGILVHLLRKVNKETPFNSISVWMYEFYDSYMDDKTSKTGLRNPSEDKWYEFDNSLNRTDKNEYEYLHPYKSKGEVLPNELADFLLYFIDTDRLVKATTNNPDSSRSHVTIIIRLNYGEDKDTKHIIFGDFAGIENKFRCNDMDVVMDFNTIKSKDKNNELVTFYSQPLEEGDPIQTGGYGFTYNDDETPQQNFENAISGIT
jgi:hypothetical protein